MTHPSLRQFSFIAKTRTEKKSYKNLAHKPRLVSKTTRHRTCVLHGSFISSSSTPTTLFLRFFCCFMLSNSQLTFVASPPTFGFTWWHYFSHPPPPFVLHHHPKEFSGSDLRKNKKEIPINNQTNKQILLLFAALISQHSIIFLGIFLGYFLGIFFLRRFCSLPNYWQTLLQYFLINMSFLAFICNNS